MGARKKRERERERRELVVKGWIVKRRVRKSLSIQGSKEGFEESDILQLVWISRGRKRIKKRELVIPLVEQTSQRRLLLAFVVYQET
jgi:hypothetical protein